MQELAIWISLLALLISVIGWVYEATQRKQLQQWVRKSIVIGSRLNVVDEYVMEAGKLAGKIQELIELKMNSRKLGFGRRVVNELAQFRVGVAAIGHNRKIAKLELNVSDTLKIVDDPELQASKKELQTATFELYAIFKQMRSGAISGLEEDVAIAQSQELLKQVNETRVAFRKQIDATLVKM